MMYKKYVTTVLAVLVLGAEANSVQHAPAPVTLSKLQERVEGLGLTADVNSYVDSTISMIVPFLQEFGLDPMDLPDVEEGFSVRPLLVTYSAWLRINRGKMTGLTNVSRSGDQTVHYFAKMLRVRVNLQFQDLRFDYRYSVQVMNLGPRGGIVATLSRFQVTVDILLDFNNDEIHMQEFSLNEIGNLRVRFTGNVLTDWLVNPVLTVFMSIFDNVIIRVVEVNIRNAVNHAIAFVNSNIREVIDTIESFNN